MDKLGHYTILEKIGEGGMGQVFRARDERLRREVAIKVLPEAFVKDPERLARFEREAQVLAQLHHPNVASIFGLDQDGETRFLVLELVPGLDLAKTMAGAGGALPVGEAMELAAQVAAAIEAAHEMGIVHRDLKPSNVMITPDGVAKVLDFGLAKAGEAEAGDSSLNLSNSPTLTGLMTNENVILGTAAYMSPEQARGKKVDKRSDIWSFGVLVFEMLTGKQLFEGETVSDTLAGVLKTEIEFETLPPSTPHHLRMLLERCLSRDPKMRLRDIGEARIVLAAGEDVGLPQGEAAPAARGGMKPWVIAVPALVALVAGLALGSFLLEPSTPVVESRGLPRQFVIGAGPGESPPQLPVISPDGTRLAYIRDESIWVRDLDKLEPRHLERTRDVVDLFWSPDGSRIGYLSASQVMSVDPLDGNPMTVTPTEAPITVESGAGGAWTEDGSILFTTGVQDIYRVSDRGGTRSLFFAADTTREGDLHEPAILPDGSLVVVPHLPEGSNRIDLIKGEDRKVILPSGPTRIYYPTWSPTGHVLYEQRGSNPGIWALPFDLAGSRPTGEPFLLFAGGSHPSAAADGTVALLRGNRTRTTRIVESDRTGRILREIGGEHDYDNALALSPDDGRLAVIRRDEVTEQIWILDLVRGTESRLTFNNAPKTSMDWSPDGRQLVYSYGTGSTIALMIQATDGSANADTLFSGTVDGNFVPDSNEMLLCSHDPRSDWDIRRGTLSDPSRPVPVVTDVDWQYAPRISPDRRYFVYVSRETGTDQVFLKRYPDGGGKWQVSVEGGNWPKFTDDGTKIVFCRGDRILEVDFETGDAPRLGVPREVFTRLPLGYAPPFGWPPDFAMSGDGERFYYFTGESDGNDSGQEIILLENWVEAFRDR